MSDWHITPISIPLGQADFDHLANRVLKAEQERDDARAEVQRLRAALERIADNPDPGEGGMCYCRWSSAVARQALGREKTN